MVQGSIGPDNSDFTNTNFLLIERIEGLTSAFSELAVEIRGLQVELQRGNSESRRLNINITELTVGLADLYHELERTNEQSRVPLAESVVHAVSESNSEVEQQQPTTADPSDDPSTTHQDDDLPLQVFPNPARPLAIGDQVRILSRQRLGEIGRIIGFTRLRVVLRIPGVNQDIYRARFNLERV